MNKVKLEYYHLPDDDGSEIRGGGGSYTGRENILQYQGREVLYIVGGTSAVTSCCGAGLGTGFIIVPGFVAAWQKKNAAGLPVSEVDPVISEDAKADIKRTLGEMYGVRNIRFW
jgi:hypothetical protein